MLIITMAIAAWKFRLQLFESLQLSLKIGWMVAFVPVLFLVWNLFASRAWHCLIQATATVATTGMVVKRSLPNFRKLYLIRIQSQALNQIVPLCGLGGEALRTVKISDETGMKSGVISVVADKSMDILAEIVLVFIGGIFASRFLPFPAASFFMAAVGLAAVSMILVFWQKTWSLFSKSRIAGFKKNVFLSFADDKRLKSGSRKAFFHHMIERVLMTGELWLIAHLLGIGLGLRELLLITTISSISSLLFIIVPGRIGINEGAMAYAFSLLSLQPEAGVSIALIRRARQILVCIAGSAMIGLQKGKQPKSKSGATPPIAAPAAGAIAE